MMQQQMAAERSLPQCASPLAHDIGAGSVGAGSPYSAAFGSPAAPPANGGGGSSGGDAYRPLARGLHSSSKSQGGGAGVGPQMMMAQSPVPPPSSAASTPQPHQQQQQQPYQYAQQQQQQQRSQHYQQALSPQPSLQQQQPDNPLGFSVPLGGLAPPPPGAGAAAAAALAPRGGSMQAVHGVTRLMQQCSSMLRERMYMGGAAAGAGAGTPGAPRSPAPFDPQEVLFPVVDSVLGQITQEYEKRLLQKDHDLSAARARAEAAAREADELRARLDAAAAERAKENAAAARAAADAAAARAAAAGEEAAALAARLAEREEELALLRGEADEGLRARAEREARLEAELDDVRCGAAAPLPLPPPPSSFRSPGLP